MILIRCHQVSGTIMFTVKPPQEGGTPEKQAVPPVHGAVSPVYEGVLPTFKKKKRKREKEKRKNDDGDYYWCTITIIPILYHLVGIVL